MKFFQDQNCSREFFENENRMGYHNFSNRTKLIYFFYGSFANFGTVEIVKTSGVFFEKCGRESQKHP